MRAMILCLAFSACSTIPRPNAHLNVVNAPGLRLKGYNIATDYDQGGQIKKTAKPRYVYFSTTEEFIEYLNKGVWMSNMDWAEVKTWIHELRKAYEETR